MVTKMITGCVSWKVKEHWQQTCWWALLLDRHVKNQVANPRSRHFPIGVTDWILNKINKEDLWQNKLYVLFIKTPNCVSIMLVWMDDHLPIKLVGFDHLIQIISKVNNLHPIEQ